MNFSKYVEEEKIKMRIQNIKELREEIDCDWVKEKIKNHAIAFGGIITEKQIREEILRSDVVASKFCKDPSKQNISEILAEKILGVKKLPGSGKNCIRFNDNGEIVYNKRLNTKSADFFYNGFYATQKYTNENGGAQDNQFADVVDFLKRGSIKHKVMAIVDGAYWDDKKEILKNEFKNNKNVLITSITEITGEDEK